MARPLKEGMDYFPHDTNATKDDKIEVLQNLYHNDGYAFYFKLLEKAYQYKGEINISISEIKDNVIRYTLLTEERFNEIMQTALKIGCFSQTEYDKGIITSKGIKKRCASVFKERERKQIERSKNKIEPDENRTNWLNITDEKIKEWQNAYQNINVRNELDAMIQWVHANPSREKLNYERFIVNWLKRSHDSRQDKPIGVDRSLHTTATPDDTPQNKNIDWNAEDLKIDEAVKKGGI